MDESKVHANERKVREVLAADPSALINWAAENMVRLGSVRQWSYDDNYVTTESFADLAQVYGLPDIAGPFEPCDEFYGPAQAVREAEAGW